MSDLPPDKDSPQPPSADSGSSTETPSGAPHWAVPAVPPAPEMESAAPSSPAPVQPAAPADVPSWAYTAPAVTPPVVAPGSQGWPGQVAPGLAPAVTPAAAPAARAFTFNRERWLPTIAVAAIIAGVVLGGMGLDKVIAAPSAGKVALGGSVTITAAPGWVLAPQSDAPSTGIELQKSDAVLTAEIVDSSFGGSSASMLSAQENALQGDTANVNYGDAHQTTISGHDTTYVGFNALVTSGDRSGIVDGELVCMVVGGNAVVIVVGAPQGDLDPVIDDVTAMLKSVGVGQ
jgi:hypothetical protein